MNSPIKIWLLTTNCGGKSEFAKQEYYRNILLLDTDAVLLSKQYLHLQKNINPYAITIPHRKNQNPILYTGSRPIPIDAIKCLNNVDVSCCLMTSMSIINIPEDILNIKVGIVCIPLGKLLLYLAKRTKKYPKYNNETQKSLYLYWNRLQKFAHQQQLPIFTSFKEAIDYYV